MATSGSTRTTLISPFQYFADPTRARPIFNGFIFIGRVDGDPTNTADQIPVQVICECGGSPVNVTQPIRTGPGGLPIYNGNPAQIVVCRSNYSITLQDNNRVQVYHSPNVQSGFVNQPITHTTLAAAMADDNSSRQLIRLLERGGAEYRRAANQAEFDGFPELGRFTDAVSGLWVLRIIDYCHIDYTGAVEGDSSVDNTPALLAASQISAVRANEGTYSFRTKCNFPMYTEINFVGHVKFNLESSAVALFEFLDGMCLTGDQLTVDTKGNDTSTNEGGLICRQRTPTIDLSCGMVIQNTTNASLWSDGAIGSGYIGRVNSVDCGRGIHVHGTEENVTSSLATITLDDLKTSGTTGSAGNIYFIQSFNHADIRGGNFTGAAQTGPNFNLCSTVTVSGGKYYNINRGPTLGRRTRNFTITGTQSINCTFAAIAPDLRDDDPGNVEFPPSYGIVKGNVAINCGFGCRWQGSDGMIVDNMFLNCTTSDGIVRVFSNHQEGNPIYINGNVIYGAGNRQSIRASTGTHIRLGDDNITDSTNASPYASDNSANSSVIYGETSELSDATSNITVRDEVLFIQSGVTSLNLPSNTFSKCLGKTFRIIRDGNTSNIVVRALGGGGTVNGQPTYTWQSADSTILVACKNPQNDYLVLI